MRWFIGGEIEDRDEKHGTLHCGRIGEIDLIRKKIRIRLKWFAQAHGYTGTTEDRVRWIRDHRREYSVPTENLRFSVMGLFTRESSLVLIPFESTKLITLTPRNLCLLDSKLVEGLEIEQR